ncbi:MAG: bifunctional acetate--CoA ligase family protein/GNAT family N-acetyltransferase, partial [Planctomycetaceae bacterium]|nr:bifunctional acetate--CoA ligase family protein/GNAT family N-acetyltransferase [Planctomycetaceae bacterium]
AFFAPQSIAVIGASDKARSIGRTLVWNLITSPFGGTVFPVNPKRPRVLGIKAHPRIGDVPDQVDLAIVATPAPTVPALIAECVEAGVQAAIVVSGGFKEIGAIGADLERQIMGHARRGRLRVIGTNSLGVMSPFTGLNATVANAMARPGRIAFLSQSGALGAAVLDWSLQANVGFSAFVSVGSQLDVGWGDLIDYFGNDMHTQSIIIYMESIGDARSFISAAREVALSKPIIVIKPGRTKGASRAVTAHTGSLTGSDEVLNAAFHRCGVLRVDRISELFSMADILNIQPRPKGRRLTILTNAGGPGVLATDALIAGGGRLAPLAPESIEALNRTLPLPWSHSNPVDLLGDASPDRYVKALEVVARDPNTNGLLVILTPQAMIDPTLIADQLKAHCTIADKPVLASWMGGDEVAAGVSILHRAGIPSFPYPDTAARAFNHMWRYSQNIRSLYETPELAGGEDGGADRAGAEDLIASVLAAGRTLLTEAESKRLLELYRIPVVPTRVATTEEQAVALAAELGYPGVLKLHSQTITHKTDVGGVRLNLTNPKAVRRAYRAIERSVSRRVGAEHFLGVTVQPMIKLDGYELIIGCSPDPQFGPVLLFGAGGRLVELSRDHKLGLPPLNTTLARRMMERTRIFRALMKGVRGRRPVDLGALERLLVRFSGLVVEQPRIKEIDINPLLASHKRLIALDARVVLHGAEVDLDRLPRPAISPYPTQYVAPWTGKDGLTVTIRPIRPEDEPLVVRFDEKLSEDTVYMRYFQTLKLSRRIAHERMIRICFIDFDREMALVAEYKDPQTGEREIIAMGRWSRTYDRSEAEFSLLVRDGFQRRGLGTELLRRLVAIGRDERLHRITAVILPQNQGMLRTCSKLGFHTQLKEPDHLMYSELILSDSRS